MQKRRFDILALLVITFVMLGGCAGRGYLIVDYSVTPRSQRLDGQTVRIQVEDMRKTKAVLEPRASRAFPDFQNRYSLAWVMPNRQRILAGEHDIATLFEQAFKKRLERMGAKVVYDKDPSIPVLNITMKKVRLKLIGVKWYATITCSAGLLLNDQHVAGETVTGNAERVRVVGRKGADVILGNIFSDVVNRIDIVNLFKRAKLI